MFREFNVKFEDVEMLGGADNILEGTEVTKVIMKGDNKMSSLQSALKNCKELDSIDGGLDLNGVENINEILEGTPLVNKIDVKNINNENISTRNAFNNVDEISIGGNLYNKKALQNVIASKEWTFEGFKYKDEVGENITTKEVNVVDDNKLVIKDTLEQKAKGIEIEGQTYINLINGKGEASLTDELSIESIDGKSEFDVNLEQQVCVEVIEGETYQNLVDGKGEHKLTDDFSVTITENNSALDNPSSVVEVTEIWGNTVQDENDLSIIQSVGDLYVNENNEPILDEDGNKQYKLEVESISSSNLFNINGKINSVLQGSNIVWGDEPKVEGNNITTYNYGEADGYGQFINVKPNTKYTLSFAKEDNYVYAIKVFGNHKNNHIATAMSHHEGKITFDTSDNSIIFIMFLSMRVDEGGTIRNLKLEEGSTSTEYTPYQSNKTTILMPCQLSRIISSKYNGGYLTECDKLYYDISSNKYLIEKNISEYTTPNINYQGELNIILNLPSDMVSSSNNYDNYPFIIQDAKVRGWARPTDNYFGVKRYNESTSVRLATSNTFTNEEVSSFLSNKKILYITSSPQVIETKILEKPSLETYSPTTYISTNSEVQPSQMSIVNKQTILSPLSLQANTDYTLQLDSVGKDNKNITVNLGGTETTIQPTNDTGKHHKVVVRTPATLTNETLELSGEGVIVNDIMLFEGGSNVIKQEVKYVEGIESIGEVETIENLIKYDVVKDFTYGAAGQNIYTDEDAIVFDFDKVIRYNTWITMPNPFKKNLEIGKEYTLVVPILENTTSGTSNRYFTIYGTTSGSALATLLFSENNNLEVGVIKSTFKFTAGTNTDNSLRFRLEGNNLDTGEITRSGKLVLSKDFMLLEGDYSNKSIPSFVVDKLNQYKIDILTESSTLKGLTKGFGTQVTPKRFMIESKNGSWTQGGILASSTYKKLDTPYTVCMKVISKKLLDNNYAFAGSWLGSTNAFVNYMNDLEVGVVYKKSITPQAEVKEDDIICVFQFSNNAVNGQHMEIEIWLEEDVVKSETQIALPQQLRKIGDVADKLYWDKDKGHYCIEQNIFPMVLDGSQSYEKQWANKGYNCYAVNTSNPKKQYGDTVISDKLSVGGDCYISPRRMLYIAWNTLIYIVLEEEYNIKSWLSDNPVTVYYLGDTPTIIDLPHLNKKNSLDTYMPITHIECNNLNLKPSRLLLESDIHKYDVNELKANEEYTMQFNCIEKGTNPIKINLDNVVKNVDPALGLNHVNISTESINGNLLKLSGSGNKISNIMLVEGSMNQYPSYFDGVQSVGELQDDGNYKVDIKTNDGAISVYDNGKKDCDFIIEGAAKEEDNRLVLEHWHDGIIKTSKKYTIPIGHKVLAKIDRVDYGTGGSYAIRLEINGEILKTVPMPEINSAITSNGYYMFEYQNTTNEIIESELKFSNYFGGYYISEISICSPNSNSLNHHQSFTLQQPLMKIGDIADKLYWNKSNNRYEIDRNGIIEIPIVEGDIIDLPRLYQRGDTNLIIESGNIKPAKTKIVYKDII